MPDGYDNPYDDPLFNKKQREMVISSDTDTDRKKKVAVAIAYDPGDTAPKIVASGKGNIADKIIDKAQENGIPLHKDDKLADTLSLLELGDYIPPELYEVVAQVLLFVDRLDHLKEKLDMDNNKVRR